VKLVGATGAAATALALTGGALAQDHATAPVVASDRSLAATLELDAGFAMRAGASSIETEIAPTTSIGASLWGVRWMGVRLQHALAVVARGTDFNGVVRFDQETLVAPQVRIPIASAATLRAAAGPTILLRTARLYVGEDGTTTTAAALGGALEVALGAHFASLPIWTEVRAIGHCSGDRGCGAGAGFGLGAPVF
jgi:hypothetical protein